jgi:hypothetical protein
MSSKVDNFFKTKLEEHSLPPSVRSWEKIEANLSKKNKTILWFRLAAAVALMGIFMFAILQWMDKGDVPPTLVLDNKKIESPKVEQKESSKRKETVPNQKPQHKSIATTTLKKVKQKEKENFQVEKEELLITKKEEPITETQITEATENVASQKPITLTFTLPTIKPKNISQEEQMAVAEEKRTALQKVVETANDIRTGDALGDFREAKNELFALEFRKDKSKKQE